MSSFKLDAVDNILNISFSQGNKVQYLGEVDIFHACVENFLPLTIGEKYLLNDRDFQEF